MCLLVTNLLKQQSCFICLLLCYYIKERSKVGLSCSADTIQVVFLVRIYCWEASNSSVSVCICMCIRAQARRRLACLQSRRSSLTHAGHTHLLQHLSPIQYCTGAGQHQDFVSTAWLVQSCHHQFRKMKAKKDTSIVLGAHPSLCTPASSTATEALLDISSGTAATAQENNYFLLSAVRWKLIFSHFKSCLHAFQLPFQRAAILFNCCSLTRYVLAKRQISVTML